ncbi:hypothetical protein HETIRDRAFT_328334 [Heterobasidion irregulare TC 32-1]|uniref:Uncharacterized protein n=1 Tax=Heterobasidion irregulare (strain TC 32-1) TaxID=747525 RepID=W4JS52_HETIT|nr:uncharacterized protein HETIRDRAFT_328334 [Heterobasidion irregulare TC 32-1]ETW76387.1 hypothetical protein HETIRDRAFT_328334 [Heterobasidion irregulare TC 32-1]
MSISFHTLSPEVQKRVRFDEEDSRALPCHSSISSLRFPQASFQGCVTYIYGIGSRARNDLRVYTLNSCCMLVSCRIYVRSWL